MDLSKLTLKSQSALEAARELASARNQQSIEPVHVLAALLADPEGVVYPLLHRLGVSPRTLQDRAEEAIEQIPKVYAQGAEVYLGDGTRQLLEAAFKQAEALTDEYVSTEHLFLALLDGSGPATDVLRGAGIERDAVLSALAEVRGRQRVTDQNPEEKYQALESSPGGRRTTLC
jgi:ATP-dependent Clp protease ATP-binding subunit ClpB